MHIPRHMLNGTYFCVLICMHSACTLKLNAKIGVLAIPATLPMLGTVKVWQPDQNGSGKGVRGAKFPGFNALNL